MQKRIEEAARLLAGARRAAALTGAGVSAESGVPTFRGPGGYWRNHRPEDLATPGAYARDPELVWEWYLYRRRLVASCEPNAAHSAPRQPGSLPGGDSELTAPRSFCSSNAMRAPTCSSSSTTTWAPASVNSQ